MKYFKNNIRSYWGLFKLNHYYTNYRPKWKIQVCKFNLEQNFTEFQERLLIFFTPFISIHACTP